MEVNLYAVKLVVWCIRFGNIFCGQKRKIDKTISMA